jgi:hypothetical protein
VGIAGVIFWFVTRSDSGSNETVPTSEGSRPASYLCQPPYDPETGIETGVSEEAYLTCQEAQQNQSEYYDSQFDSYGDSR